MGKNRMNYRDLDRKMTLVILATTAIFLLYLICCIAPILWLKVITAIVAILSCSLSLAWLYLTKEILRQRSLWLTTGFGGILICVLVSLITGFP